MKHTINVTLLLLLMFFTAQVVGLYLLSYSIQSINTAENGTITVNYAEPVTGRPDLQGQSSFTYMLVMILIGTVLLLLLIRFRLFKVWKAWFFVAVWGALFIAFSVLMDETLAAILALVLTIFKIFKPNIFIHNLTEVFMYGGIALLVSPIFNIFWATMLLLAISVYDALAVWKLKHMITLATAQAKEKMFAGLLVPYSREDPIKEVKPRPVQGGKAAGEFKLRAKPSMKVPEGFEDKEVKSAILGGGDIAFPLLYTGAVMTDLIQNGISRVPAYFLSLVVSVFAGGALFLLLVKGKKDTFYPAMPFITAGCLIGYGLVRLAVFFLLRH